MKIFNIKSGQASLEYITIFGIAFIILTIMGGIFFSYVSESKQALDKQQVDAIATEIMSNVDKIYFLGNGNRLTVAGSFPQGIDNISIIHLRTPSDEPFEVLNISFVQEGERISSLYEAKEIYIRFNCTLCTHNTITNISSFNPSDFSAGVKNIRVESKGDWVSIDFINDLS